MKPVHISGTKTGQEIVVQYPGMEYRMKITRQGIKIETDRYRLNVRPVSENSVVLD